MNNDEDKNDSEESPFSDSMELFDSLFREEADKNVDDGKNKESKAPSDSQEMFDKIFKEEIVSGPQKLSDSSISDIDDKFDAAFAEDLSGNDKPAQTVKKAVQSPASTPVAVSGQKMKTIARPQAGKGNVEKGTLPKPAPETKIAGSVKPLPPVPDPGQKKKAGVVPSTGKGGIVKKVPAVVGKPLKEEIPEVQEQERKIPVVVSDKKKITTVDRSGKRSRLVGIVMGMLILFITGGIYFFNNKTEDAEKTKPPAMEPETSAVTQQIHAEEATMPPDTHSAPALETVEKATERSDKIQTESDFKNTPEKRQEPVAESDMDGATGKSPAENHKEVSEKPEQERTLETEKISDSQRPSYPYSIYFGSYKKPEDIQKAVQKYNSQALSLFWAKINLREKGIWYRVFGGYFATRESADKYIKENGIEGAESKHTEYSVLLGRFSSKDDMKSKMQLLDEKGFNYYVIDYGNGDARLYAGAFFQKSEATEFKTELESNGIQSIVVKR